MKTIIIMVVALLLGGLYTAPAASPVTSSYSAVEKTQRIERCVAHCETVAPVEAVRLNKSVVDVYEMCRNNCKALYKGGAQ